MTHHLHLSSAHAVPAAPARHSPHGVLAGSWSPSITWMAGVVMCLLVALATLAQVAWTAGELSPPSATTTPEPAEVSAPAQARERTRCTGCGVVESIQRMAPVGSAAAGYEFTVRLRDGSARVSNVIGTTAAAWAVGDSIILIGGI